MRQVIAASLVERVGRLAVSFVVITLVARQLGVDDFGRLSLALAVVALFGPLVVLGLDQICVRNLIVHPQKKGTLLGTTALLQGAGGMMVVLLVLGGLLLVQPSSGALVAIASLSLLLQWPAAGEYALRAKGQMATVAIARTIATLGYLVVAAGLLALQAGVYAFAWLTVADLALLALAQGWMLRSVTATAPLHANLQTARELLHDAWPLVLAGMAVMVYMRTDQVMLAYFVGDSAVGGFAAAARISDLWYVLPTTVAYVAGPILLGRGSPNSREYLEPLHAYTRGLVALTYMAIIATMIAPAVILDFVYGPTYAAFAPVLTVHFWSVLFVVLGVMQGQWLIARNATRFTLLRTLVGAVVNVLLNLALIPPFGAVGAAFGTLAAQVCATFLTNFIYEDTRLFMRLQIRALLLLPFPRIPVFPDGTLNR